MIDSVSKAIFHSIAGSRRLKSLASRYGMRQPRSFARRFIAGETVEDAIAAAREVEALGMTQTLDYLGESVASMAEADQATRACLRIIESIAAAGIGRNVSLKLTQLGLTVDRATSVDNLRRVLDAATRHDFFVRVDMEHSAFTAVTLDIIETMWQQGYRNAGVVLQSYLKRSPADARRMNQLGVRVRLCKGAYKEPRSIAYQARADIDAAFVTIMKVLLTDGALSRDRHARSGDDSGHARVCGEHRSAGGSLGVPDALRHTARPAVGARRGRLSRANLHSVRTGMVPVLHAAARRAARKRRFRPQKSGQRTVKSLPAAGAPPTASCIKAPDSPSFR